MDLDDNLLAYYKLNENAGLIANDSVGFFRAGRNTTLSARVVFKMTDRGNSAYFDGSTTTNIKVSKPAIFDVEASQMTVSCWAKFDSVGNYRYLVSDYNSAANNAQFALQHTNTNRITFFWARAGVQAPNPFTAAGTTATAAGVWYHCVGVREGATGNWTARIHINGRRENSTATSGNPARIADCPNVAIGAAGDYTGGLNMIGNIQRVMLWNRALTDTEIKCLYSCQKNLVSNWGMP